MTILVTKPDLLVAQLEKIGQLHDGDVLLARYASADGVEAAKSLEEIQRALAVRLDAWLKAHGLQHVLLILADAGIDVELLDREAMRQHGWVAAR